MRIGYERRTTTVAVPRYIEQLAQLWHTSVELQGPSGHISTSDKLDTFPLQQTLTSHGKAGGKLDRFTLIWDGGSVTARLQTG